MIIKIIKKLYLIFKIILGEVFQFNKKKINKRFILNDKKTVIFF